MGHPNGISDGLCLMGVKRMPKSNGNAYNPFVALNMARQDRSAREGIYVDPTAKEAPRVSYKSVLEWVQEKISSTEEMNKTLMDSLDSDQTNDQLKAIIYSLLQQHPAALDMQTVQDYKVRIYEDMAGLSILTPYIDDPNVEEINVFGPGPEQIEIITGDGSYMLHEGFDDAESVLNIAKRMVRKGNMVIDQSNPRVDSYMNSGVRVSVMIPPIIREDKGAVISVRKQTKARITRADLINTTSAMAEEFEFIELCTRNKVSGALVGATGSGKTTLLNYLMSDYVENTKDEARVYIIEESRELQLPENARVIYTAVCGDEKSGTEITAPDLLKSALRFHPTFISCAEMRGEEAMNAMTAAQTGHIVWSTFHADNCVEAYQRLLTMCKMSGTDLSEHLLMRNLVSAFPIIISTQQMKDGTRKITGIYEAEDVDGVQVVGHYIYRLQISGYEYNADGTVAAVHGHHARVGYLSDKMAQRIFDNCGRKELVKKFARPDWEPESAINMQNAAASGYANMQTF